MTFLLKFPPLESGVDNLFAGDHVVVMLTGGCGVWYSIVIIWLTEARMTWSDKQFVSSNREGKRRDR